MAKSTNTTNPNDGKSSTTGTYTVIASFRDIKNYDKVYNVGDDVSDMDEKRLQTLVGNKLVEKK